MADFFAMSRLSYTLVILWAIYLKRQVFGHVDSLLVADRVSRFFFLSPTKRKKNIFLANGCRVISPSRSSGQQARRDRQQHVQHTTTTMSYIYMSWCCVVGFQQSPRLFERPRAIVQQHETHCCVVPSHMHRSNKVHSNIDRPIDFPSQLP